MDTLLQDVRYAVRTLVSVEDAKLESDDSPPKCVTSRGPTSAKPGIMLGPTAL